MTITEQMQDAESFVVITVKRTEANTPRRVDISGSGTPDEIRALLREAQMVYLGVPAVSK